MAFITLCFCEAVLEKFRADNKQTFMTMPLLPFPVSFFFLLFFLRPSAQAYRYFYKQGFFSEHSVKPNDGGILVKINTSKLHAVLLARKPEELLIWPNFDRFCSSDYICS